jgi:4-amino-4-deoxy-L-arabinose transferase-like glycosyltransferase
VSGTTTSEAQIELRQRARSWPAWLPWLGLWVLALALRWGYAVSLPPDAPVEAVDAQGYHALAVNLVAGRGFSLNTEAPFVPDGIRTPLYPVFVAAVYAASGPIARHVTLVQGALDAATALIVLAVARRLLGRGWAPWAAGGLYALNPAAWRFSNVLLTEIVLAAALAWMLWAWVRYASSRRSGWLVAAAVLAAVAALIKPNVVLVPALVAAATLLLPAQRTGTVWRQRVGLALVVLGVAGALLLPWLVRNRIVFGRWLFSHAFDNNLARVSAVATLAQVQGERVAPWTPRWEALYSGLLLEAEARYDDFVGQPRTAGEADRFQQQVAAVAWDVIRLHPLDFAAAHLGGFFRSWVPQEHRFWYGQLAHRSWDSLHSEEGVLRQAFVRLRSGGPMAAAQYVWRARFADLPPLARALWLGWLAAYAASAALLALGTWRWRDTPALLWLCWSPILYSTFLPGPIAEIRFRVPVVPLLLVVMAAGLAPARRRWGSRKGPGQPSLAA